MDRPLHRFHVVLAKNLKYECKTHLFSTLVRHKLQIHIMYMSFLQIEVHLCTRYKYNASSAMADWAAMWQISLFSTRSLTTFM